MCFRHLNLQTGLCWRFTSSYGWTQLAGNDATGSWLRQKLTGYLQQVSIAEDPFKEDVKYRSD